MNRNFTTKAKKILSKFLPNSDKLRYLAYLPKLEMFRKNHIKNCPVFLNRPALYHYLNESVIQHKALDYLEFGVFDGYSIKHWAKINSDPASRFYGFDTFTGLPEEWSHFDGSTQKASFSNMGKYPDCDDKRVNFIQGMFQETLSPFLETYSSIQQQLIHCDADLYSSTLYVLTTLNRTIAPGTIIVFDEFSSMLSEFRALEDYCCSYIRKFEVIATTLSSKDYYSQMAIRMI
ncbi:MAG: class I SAM-dependent methyltransferase [Candidatus Brocadiae bacterium]|nr:class I SAM-dependent methyltransferase [Candidatus Brocadiia bacterium]